MLKHIIFTLFLLITFLAIPTNAARQENFSNTLSQDEMINVSVYEQIVPSIVGVEGNVPDGVSSGTGCIIASNGIILTSSHVINDCKDIEVTVANGKVYPAKVLSVLGDNKDLALLKIEPQDPLKVIRLGDSEKVKVGQKVLAIGNPFGLSGTLTTGIVSRIDYERNKIQTDAAINPGSSGGPLLNTHGEVIGISQSIYNPDNNKSNIGIGFAVPINEAKSLIKASLK